MSEQDSRPANLSPAMQMMQFIWPGAMAAQAIYVAAKLEIADLVADGPKTADELAQATKTHGPSLRRVLRALTSVGIFGENPAGGFQHTRLSETLRSDHPESVRPWAVMLGAPFIWRPSGELCETVVRGQPGFDRIYGERFFDYLASHPDDAAVFNAAMSAGSSFILSAVLAAYDFSKFERIVDVGGGQGGLLHGILSANPELRGVLYDLPAVVAGAAPLRSGAIAARCEILGGDFFEAVPQGADALILKGIIHDWSDEEALKILKNCRRAIRRDGKLLLIEGILKPSGESNPGIAFTDLLMLVLLTGRERTESDFRALLREAGFSVARVIRTAGPSSIIESQPLIAPAP